MRVDVRIHLAKFVEVNVDLDCVLSLFILVIVCEVRAILLETDSDANSELLIVAVNIATIQLKFMCA